MQYGCIAEHLGHSFSPEIHAALADYRYELCEIAPNDLERFVSSRDFRGINVTIPYKERVIPYLDEIDPMAQKIGAVNTVINREGRLYGYNTDFYGMKAMLFRMGLTLQGKKVAVLGTGGTSRTARAVAADLGAGEILCVSRSQRDGAITYDTLYRDHTDAHILINTTPCGMFPNPDAAAVDVSAFSALEGVADAVFNPLRSRLVTQAKRLGVAAEGGLFMLVAQAVCASELFLDTTQPQGITERIYQRLLRKKENIVLVGMPGSGKTTVGKLLAKRLGREFYDLDDCVQKETGFSPSELINTQGESVFRSLETRVLKERLAQKTSCVIATGGGTILRDENVEALSRNGRLYFIDRPLEKLSPTDDRPLSSTRDALKKRYEERYTRYCAVCDVRVDVIGDPKRVAEQIEKEYEEP